MLFLTIIGSGAVLQAQENRQDTLKELNRKVDILTEELERMKLGEVADTGYEPRGGLGPAAAKVYRLKKSGVSIAGYGEIVYENYARQRDNNQNANRTDMVDFVRGIVYVGYCFNDWILFNSEIEFEHGSTGEGGEVSVEFGYVELMLSRNANLRAGMVLAPLGIINERHEPTTFFTTLRPQVERYIIPTTWRANAIGLYGEIVPALGYRAYVMEGLNARSFSDADGVRGGRQSGARALAQDLAFAGRLEYDGIEGATLGASMFTGNSGQGASDSLGSISARTSLWSVHAEYSSQGLDVRGVYGNVAVDQADRVSTLTGKTVGSVMRGWYVVAGYDIMPLVVPGTEHYLAPYVQYEKLNTQASVAAGYSANPVNDRSALTLGLTYKPHPNVAFKVDFIDNKNDAGTGLNQWNAAVNYLF